MQHRGGKGWASRFRPSRREPTASRGWPAPPAPPTLAGALGLARQDLSCHGTCAPAAMAGLAARPMALGDGRMAMERATQVIVTRERGCIAWLAIGKGTTWQPDEQALGKGQTDEQPRRATQVAATQVSGAGSEGARRGRRRGRKRCRNPTSTRCRRGRTDEQPRCFGAERISTKEWLWE